MAVTLCASAGADPVNPKIKRETLMTGTQHHRATAACSGAAVAGSGDHALLVSIVSNVATIAVVIC